MLFNIISISLGAILINNFIFSQFLGCCPFLGCSNKVDTAFGMGVAVIFVMGMASAICWLIDTYILVPLGLAFLETLAFILIIAALVQLVEMFLKKSVPALYSALGIYLPLITTNCAVLGVVLLNVQNHYNFIESVVYGITGGIGLEYSRPNVGHFMLEARYYYGLGNIYGNTKRDYFGRSNFSNIVIKASYLFDIAKTKNDKIK